MTDPQRNKLSMYFAVLGVLQTYAATWNGLTAFAALVGQLDSLAGAISTASGVQGTPKTGIAGGKSRRQLEMIQFAVECMGDVHSWAATVGDEDIMAQSDVELTTLVRMSDALVGPYCRTLHTLANAHLAEITPLGTTAADLAEFDAAIEAYLPLVSKPREAIVAHKGVTGDIKTDVAAADQLLKTQLDKAMRKWTRKNPGFATAYQNARIIVDLGSGGTPPTPPQPPTP